MSAVLLKILYTLLRNYLHQLSFEHESARLNFIDIFDTHSLIYPSLTMANKGANNSNRSIERSISQVAKDGPKEGDELNHLKQYLSKYKFNMKELVMLKKRSFPKLFTALYTKM